MGQLALRAIHTLDLFYFLWSSLSLLSLPLLIVNFYLFLSHLALDLKGLLFRYSHPSLSSQIEIVDAWDSRLKTVELWLILIDSISLRHSLCKAVQLWCDGQQMVNVQQTSIVGKTIQNRAVGVISSARLHF